LKAKTGVMGFVSDRNTQTIKLYKKDGNLILNKLEVPNKGERFLEVATRADSSGPGDPRGEQQNEDSNDSLSESIYDSNQDPNNSNNDNNLNLDNNQKK